jgi:Orotate phosphoribosyltransferase
MTEWICQCPAAGQCSLLKRRMSPRQHAVCNGTLEGLTESDRLTYLSHWMADAIDDDPSLIGNQLAAFTKRLGIPHCKGCEQHRLSLNRIHRWLRGDKPKAALRFVTRADLMADIALLLGLLPSKLSGVIGVARSGLAPATFIAMELHLPLWCIRQDTEDIVFAGHGFRLTSRDPRGSTVGEKPPGGTMLVVDDTSMTGNSVTHVSRIIARRWPSQRFKTAVVYRNPAAKGTKPDYWVHDLNHPHFLEWNLFNSIHLPRMAIDFDGILTYDGTNHPQYLPRKGDVPLIVTGRSEAHRLSTQAWLQKHRVKAKRLVMFPGATPTDPLAIARYKADNWEPSRLQYFVESDPIQAAELARIVKRPVICPAAAEVF